MYIYIYIYVRSAVYIDRVRPASQPGLDGNMVALAHRIGPAPASSTNTSCQPQRNYFVCMAWCTLRRSHRCVHNICTCPRAVPVARHGR